MSHSTLQQENEGEINNWLVNVTSKYFACYLAFYPFVKNYGYSVQRRVHKVTPVDSILEPFNVADTFKITAPSRISFNVNASHVSVQKLLQTRPFLKFYTRRNTK
jgi:hypothetical protein